jgi:hypothetical protein
LAPTWQRLHCHLRFDVIPPFVTPVAWPHNRQRAKRRRLSQRFPTSWCSSSPGHRSPLPTNHSTLSRPQSTSTHSRSRLHQLAHIIHCRAVNAKGSLFPTSRSYLTSHPSPKGTSFRNGDSRRYYRITLAAYRAGVLYCDATPRVISPADAARANF